MPDEFTNQFLRSYLVAQGVVRKPTVAGDTDGDPPPLYLDPERTPAPGEKPKGNARAMHPELVLGSYTDTLPTTPYEGFVRTDFLDFRLRVKGNRTLRAHTMEAQLRSLLDDKRDWDMAGLQVHESLIVRGLQRYDVTEDGVVSYSLEYSFMIFS